METIWTDLLSKDPVRESVQDEQEVVSDAPSSRTMNSEIPIPRTETDFHKPCTLENVRKEPSGSKGSKITPPDKEVQKNAEILKSNWTHLILK